MDRMGVDRMGTVLVSREAYSDGSFKQVVRDAQNRPRTGPRMKSPAGFFIFLDEQES